MLYIKNVALVTFSFFFKAFHFAESIVNSCGNWYCNNIFCKIPVCSLLMRSKALVVNAEIFPFISLWKNVSVLRGWSFSVKKNQNYIVIATDVNKHININHCNMFIHTTQLCQFFVHFVKISTHDICRVKNPTVISYA